MAEGGSARSSFSGWIDETGLAVYTYPCIVQALLCIRILVQACTSMYCIGLAVYRAAGEQADARVSD